ncbi:MAG: hypothetical protein NTZ05_20955, partial [Chloroflexi bacterium]|nr:hypothetical protein [Chloroflexota bacterium]
MQRAPAAPVPVASPSLPPEGDGAATAPAPPVPAPRRWPRPSLDLLAVAFLALVVLALHPALALSGGALADLDAFAYFLPYRHALGEALAAGRLPLWNPLIFGGAPFLANVQTAVFYPPSWIGAVVDAPRAVGINLVFHWWLAAAGMYAWCRAGLALPRPAALLGALCYSLSGLLAAHAGHLNQASAAAWLPLIFVLYEQARRRRSLPLATLGGAALALQLLAGHPQVSYLTVLALGAFALWQAAQSLRTGPTVAAAPTPLVAGPRPRPTPLAPSIGGKGLGDRGPFPFFRRLALALRATGGPTAALVALGYMGMLAAALAAAQLLPTAELSSHSLRSGGMTMDQASSFSLPPWELLRGLLPAYHGYPFGEYIAYIGAAPLLLAVAAVAWRRDHPATLPLALLAGGALALALGHFLPLYWFTYKLLPGATLFRVPARWLLIWVFAGSSLAAIGLSLFWQTVVPAARALNVPLPPAPLAQRLAAAGPLWTAARPFATSRLLWPVLPLALIALLAAWQNALPGPDAVAAWLAAGGLAALALLFVRRAPRRGPLLGAAVIAVTLAELAAARQGLGLLTVYPAEMANGVRPSAPAVIELAREGRILSLVNTAFKPGDEDTLRARLSPPLTTEQMETFLSAGKLKEAGGANTGMLSG